MQLFTKKGFITYLFLWHYHRCKVKLSLHAMEAHGEERRYSSYPYLTSALDGGEWLASCPGYTLSPGKGPPVPIVQEAGWAPELVWMQGLEEKSSASVGDWTLATQPTVRHYTAWATAAPLPPMYWNQNSIFRKSSLLYYLSEISLPVPVFINPFFVNQ
jgi:hypothetical protein